MKESWFNKNKKTSTFTFSLCSWLKRKSTGNSAEKSCDREKGQTVPRISQCSEERGGEWEGKMGGGDVTAVRRRVKEGDKVTQPYLSLQLAH